MRSAWLASTVVAVGLGAFACVGDDPISATPTPDASTLPDAATPTDAPVTAEDAGPDAEPTCDPAKDFASPVLLQTVNSSDAEYGARLTDDELNIVFTRKQVAYTARRSSRSEPFGTASPLVVQNGAPIEAWMSGDGLRLIYVQSTGLSLDLFTATRGTVIEGFGPGMDLGKDAGPNTLEAQELQPFLSDDGKELWYVHAGVGTNGSELYRSTSSNGTFGPGGPVTEVNSPGGENLPVISRDRKTIYFSSNRPFDGGAPYLVYVATRASEVGTFGTPTPLTALGTATPSWLSTDGCRLYVEVQGDIHVATRPP
jgi:hypothetical protein